MSISAPPELPGLIAASVWMKKPKSDDAGLRARQRRDDAMGHGLADAEGIADGEHDVADLERVGIAEIDDGKCAAALEPQDGEIGALVAQHDVGVKFPLVGERDLHIGHAFDDVTIGDDEAGRIDDERPSQAIARSGRRDGRRRRRRNAGKRDRRKRIARLLVDPRGIDIDHRGRRLLDDRGEGQKLLAASSGACRTARSAPSRRRAEKQRREAGAISATPDARKNALTSGSLQ